jgi:AcrR family transcriptional regulator
MSPRPYQLGRRQAQIDESRRRVLDAARAVLGGDGTGFSVDAVAREADVARATVYYQFGSRSGLLEAVCDDLADEGGMAGLAGAFTRPDLDGALAELATVFGAFWSADRPAMRRLRALAALDPDVAAVIAARDERRLSALTALLARHGAGSEPVRAVYALTAFETYDTLAGQDTIEAVVPTVARLAGAAAAVLARPDASPPAGASTSVPPTTVASTTVASTTGPSTPVPSTD